MFIFSGELLHFREVLHLIPFRCGSCKTKKYGIFFQREAKSNINSSGKAASGVGAVLGEMVFALLGLYCSERKGREAVNRHINVIITSLMLWAASGPPCGSKGFSSVSLTLLASSRWSLERGLDNVNAKCV